MRIGIGLPNPVPDTEGDTLVEWARRSEEAGFSTLATIDRVVYPSYDSLISLAAAAAVTERIGLMTNILLAPLRNEVLLTKESASVDRLSAGRLTLGLAVGGRPDDPAAHCRDQFSRPDQASRSNRVRRRGCLRRRRFEELAAARRRQEILRAFRWCGRLDRRVQLMRGDQRRDPDPIRESSGSL
jgi:alkanesulfonate monooxygenase SsuD/methylene tetrahydromethanopterin reductase-like flavin-dependent oxidoreductase (luciferase family)